MEIRFGNGPVPVKVAAKVLHTNVDVVKKGIIEGWIPIGFATRRGQRITEISELKKIKGSGRIMYYISPIKLYEFSGYIWEGTDV